MSGTTAEQARVVLVTAPDLACARQLARGLVEQRLAACVNLLPGVESIYRWRGALESAHEVLLLVKTVAGRMGEIEGFLRAQHPYELPECVALVPGEIEARYRAWLEAEAGA